MRVCCFCGLKQHTPPLFTVLLSAITHTGALPVMARYFSGPRVCGLFFAFGAERKTFASRLGSLLFAALTVVGSRFANSFNRSYKGLRRELDNFHPPAVYGILDLGASLPNLRPPFSGFEPWAIRHRPYVTTLLFKSCTNKLYAQEEHLCDDTPPIT